MGRRVLVVFGCMGVLRRFVGGWYFGGYAGVVKCGIERFGRRLVWEYYYL